MAVAEVDTFWNDCSLVHRDAAVMHGRPVFVGTRMPVEDAIENYYAYRELQGMSDEDAVKATLDSLARRPFAVLLLSTNHWPSLTHRATCSASVVGSLHVLFCRPTKCIHRHGQGGAGQPSA